MTQTEHDIPTPHSGNIQYDRILSYREDDCALAKQFSCLYLEAFNDPDSPYGENNTIASTKSDVWHTHLAYGRITLALDRRTVVGLVCIEPIERASSEERDFSAQLIEHIRTSQHIYVSGLPIVYLSELAVRKTHRNRPDHIGQSLIISALRDLGSRDADGVFGHDDKLCVLTRTDAYRSMSKHTLARAGFCFCDDFIQHADQSEQVLSHGGKSIDKVWGYRIVHPISDC